jgi:single-strand DNA-binding protein
MYSLNTLAGRLGADPEVRTTQAGKRVVSFRLCTSSYSNGKNYDEWHTVEAWGDGLIDMVMKRLHKGDLILVTGSNRTTSWEKDGVTHYRTNVVMGPRDTLRFLNVKGAKADEVGTGEED